MRWIPCSLLCSGLLSLTACSVPVAYQPCAFRVQSGECFSQKPPADADLMLSSQQAIHLLLANAQESLVNKRIWVGALSDINHLHRNGTLGRLLGEQLGAALVQRGHLVMDGRKIFMDTEGHWRQADSWRGVARSGDALLMGTYALGADRVYITLNVLSVDRAHLVSSYAYSLPLGNNLLALLEKK
ncbi:FlgO family outer membrane protein [Thioflexithrix psekupsensis]|uniref:FlgO domain-containing protein n=1 Tax=Thioflexithrix psekupsensis TaxID=1570016 RepID=A0A251X9A8_9GAMM|nr:FlgO family outer membrane protein [Thioflexithrix psekupsensis]OUD14515.1 hypothetical protein TPSD3_09470 [Thioflexithrix psekupsensis]